MAGIKPAAYLAVVRFRETGIPPRPDGFAFAAAGHFELKGAAELIVLHEAHRA